MADVSFFDESLEQSIIKSEIVSKYFWAWAKVIIPHAERANSAIAYIDLFAGPGRYKDGTKSTPLLILEQVIADEKMRSMLITMFNDIDSNNTQSLEKAIADLSGIGTLKYQPRIENHEVGTEIVKMFDSTKAIPTLFFVDPWGYKGLSLELINSVLKNWGCDCIFFFNYNRINSGLNNDKVEEHMNALFGKDRADTLREKIKGLTVSERELTVVEALVEALQDLGGKYVLPFCFKNENSTRTSHHLVFVTKNIKGYTIMKDIMARQSSTTTDGVASFEYNPASEKQPLLFGFNRPLDNLGESLLMKFTGKTLTVASIFEQHQVGTPYILPNYKQALIKLEQEGKIKAQPPIDRRRKIKGNPTCAESVVITFPQMRR